MQFFDSFFTCYGWEGAALAGVIVLLLGVQLYYYIFVYGRLARYKNDRRAALLDAPPPISVVIPLFSENYDFVEQRLPLFLAQSYEQFEVVIVYVGHDTDFYEDLARLKISFPQITTTKIHLDPRFPISRKMALNVGIKSARHEHLVFSSTDAAPQSDRWLALMAKGFTRGDVVLGYCGLEQVGGLSQRFMRTNRMMQSVQWLGSAIRHKAYRGTLHNFGFTKEAYFGVNGFGHLNMNIGEDDLFIQQIAVRDNVSVVLSPRATLREKTWGGLKWWMGQQRYYGSAFRFYPSAAKSYVRWEIVSRVLFFAAAACAVAVMPLEYKAAAGALLLLRYLVVAIEVRRITRRLGERAVARSYFIYDLFSPFWDAWLSLKMMRRDDRVWR